MAYNPNYYGGYYQPTYGYQNGAMPDMLNQQKMQYQPQMQMPQQMVGTQMSAPAPTNEFIWVLSEVEAQSYPVAPNCTVTLWDKNEPIIYIKSANAQGVPTLRVLDFQERAANAPKQPTTHECQCSGRYVPIDRFEALERDFEAFKNECKKPTKKTQAKEGDE